MYMMQAQARSAKAAHAHAHARTRVHMYTHWHKCSRSMRKCKLTRAHPMQIAERSRAFTRAVRDETLPLPKPSPACTCDGFQYISYVHVPPISWVNS